MPLTQYLVASSLDGFIADEHDNLDWLLSIPGGNDDANPYPSFIKTVGAIAMGAITYEWIVKHDDGPWSYEQPCWVFTHRDLAPQAEADIRFTRAPAAEVHAEMVEVAGDRDISAGRRR